MKKQLKRISLDSILNAENVESSILDELFKALKNPERYSSDRYKKNNDGSFRSFETHSFRVSYKFTEKEVRVLRIRHVKQEPKEF